jgi:hypothetical protein
LSNQQPVFHAGLDPDRCAVARFPAISSSV